MVGRPSAAASNVMRVESRHNVHWPAKSSKVRCQLCSACGVRKGAMYKYAKCDVGLCVVPCFAEHHTKVNLQQKTVCVRARARVRARACVMTELSSKGTKEILQQPELCE
jgi:hypothetical protein